MDNPERHTQLSYYTDSIQLINVMKLFNIPKDQEGSARPAILMGAFVAFGGILFGYDTGTISGILAMGKPP